MGNLATECMTAPPVGPASGANAALLGLLFGALFGQSVAEAPPNQTGQKEEEDGPQAAPVVLTGFPVAVVLPELGAVLRDEAAVQSCGEGGSSQPEALTEAPEPMAPSPAELPPGRAGALEVGGEGTPTAAKELAFAARLEVTECTIPSGELKEVKAGGLLPTVGQGESEVKRAGGGSVCPVEPPESAAPQSGDRIAASPAASKAEAAGELTRAARPDQQTMRPDRGPAAPGSVTGERWPQRRVVEATSSGNLPPGGPGILEAHPASQRAVAVSESGREPAVALRELAAAPLRETKPEPVRDLTVVIPGRVTEGRKQDSVQVRLVDRAGEVRVAVHTGDRELTHSLRGQLGELVTRLEQTGYRTQTWQPAEASAGPGRIGEGRGPSGEGRTSGFERGHSGWDGQEARQQRRDSQDQPEWARNLAGAGVKEFLAGMGPEGA